MGASVHWVTLHTCQPCPVESGNIVFDKVCSSGTAGRAQKLYTSARIYEWKFGKGEWKLPFASPTGRVDLLVL